MKSGRLESSQHYRRRRGRQRGRAAALDRGAMLPRMSRPALLALALGAASAAAGCDRAARAGGRRASELPRDRRAAGAERRRRRRAAAPGRAERRSPAGACRARGWWRPGSPLRDAAGGAQDRGRCRGVRPRLPPRRAPRARGGDGAWRWYPAGSPRGTTRRGRSDGGSARSDGPELRGGRPQVEDAGDHRLLGRVVRSVPRHLTDHQGPRRVASATG